MSFFFAASWAFCFVSVAISASSDFFCVWYLPTSRLAFDTVSCCDFATIDKTPIASTSCVVDGASISATRLLFGPAM